MQQETWMSEVERQLREARDEQTLAKANTADIQIYSAFPPFTVDSEWQWIKLTSRGTSNGEFFYAWDQMIREPLTATTYQWIYGGISGSLDAYPAIELNNSNLPVNDSTRYLARWNPDTSQWIFFLKRRGSGGVTDWPTNLYCYFSFSSFSVKINYPSIPAEVCGGTRYSGLMELCLGGPDSSVIKSEKLWASWKGIEKLIAWNERVGCNFGLTPVPGYNGFNGSGNYFFPAPEPGYPVTVRWEIEINSSLPAFYTMDSPVILPWKGCSFDKSHFYQYKSTVNASGTGLTGSATFTACTNNRASLDAVINVTAPAGQSMGSMNLSGFRATIQKVSYLGAIPSTTGITAQEVEANTMAMAQKLVGLVSKIGPQSPVSACNGIPSLMEVIVNNGVIEDFQYGGNTYRVMQYAGGTSTMTGLIANSQVDPGLYSECICNTQGYLSSLPPEDMGWNANGKFNGYVGRQVGWVAPDNVDGDHFLMDGPSCAGGFEEILSCRLPKGWTKTIKVAGYVNVVKWSGNRPFRYESGRGGGNVEYTVLFEYLG